MALVDKIYVYVSLPWDPILIISEEVSEANNNNINKDSNLPEWFLPNTLKEFNDPLLPPLMPGIKPNYFKKQCSSSSFLLTSGNNTGPNWPEVLSRLGPYLLSTPLPFLTLSK